MDHFSFICLSVKLWVDLSVHVSVCLCARHILMHWLALADNTRAPWTTLVFLSIKAKAFFHKHGKFYEVMLSDWHLILVLPLKFRC